MSERRKWNFRVVREHHTVMDEPYEVLAIYEAHYEPGAPPDSLPFMLSEDGAWPSGDTVEELRGTLERMLRALDLPIVDALEWERQYAPVQHPPAPGEER